MQQRRPIWQRVPWQELWVSAVSIIAFPVAGVVLAIIGRIQPVYVLLIFIGSLGIVFWAVGNYQRMMEPWRNRVPSDKEAIGAIDRWLLDANYRVAHVQLSQFSYSLWVANQRPGAPNIWIGVDPQQNSLSFMSYRDDPANEMGTKMAPGKATEIKLDLGLEVARMGALYEAADLPVYTITFWDMIPIDDHLSAGSVLSRVSFIERIDHLINSVYAKHQLTIGPGGTTPPTFAPPSVSTPSSPPPSSPGSPAPQAAK
jgi:hypothetical protein